MKATLLAWKLFSHLLAVSFAQWHYRSQWGSSEARLLLIENFSQYPARRFEKQSALQFLSVRTWTLLSKELKSITRTLFFCMCCFLLNEIRSVILWVTILVDLRSQISVARSWQYGRRDRAQKSPYKEIKDQGLIFSLQFSSKLGY